MSVFVYTPCVFKLMATLLLFGVMAATIPFFGMALVVLFLLGGLGWLFDKLPEPKQKPVEQWTWKDWLYGSIALIVVAAFFAIFAFV